MNVQPTPEPKLQFLGLDPRKTKKNTIEGLVSPLGSLIWRRMPPLGLSGYADTAQRADEAYAAAQRPMQNQLAANAQKKIYGWQYNGSRSYFERHQTVVAVAWNGLNGSRRAFMDGARDAGARTLYFELAPIKGRITCDPIGVNQMNSLPRDIGFYLNWMDKTSATSNDWRSYRASITQRASVHQKPTGNETEISGGPYLFAPLQVPGDSQLRLFGGRFKTVPDFIDALILASDALPKGWHLKIKEHPTADQSYANLITGRSPKVVLDNRSDTFALVAGSSGVITVNSSVGLEAMFFDKPVIACGESFWALEGLASSASDTGLISAFFAQPEAISFDTSARAAFLTYLLQDYYLAEKDGMTEAPKILKRINAGIVA